jgi:hypothetical protein
LKQKYKTYKIKPTDTLGIVAKGFQKTKQEIKEFHNIFCSHEEIIKKDFPASLENLYIYPYLDVYANDNRPKVKFESGQNLVFNPIIKKINYGVMYTITVGEEVNTMKFEACVEFIKKEENGLFLFQIDRLSKTFINDEETDSIADQIAEKAASVIYPLKIIVNKKGNWKSIYNFKDILKRWKDNKKAILEEYQGQWVEKYLELNEQTLSEKFILENALSKDWFLSAYFGNIFINYTDLYSNINKVEFPLLSDCASLHYEVEQTIEKYLDEYNLVNISQNGLLVEERSKMDIENSFSLPYFTLLDPNSEKAKGKFRSRYFLDKENTIESVFIECTIDLDIPRKLEVVISVL